MTTMEATRPLTGQELRRFIEENRVCWETTVHRDLGPAGVRAVGYDITLLARCLERACDPGGACARELYRQLIELAAAVLPHASHDDDVRIQPFEPAFHLRPQTDWRPEVQVVIEVRHEREYFAAIDDGERTAVRAIERALAALGVGNGVWRDQPQKTSAR